MDPIQLDDFRLRHENGRDIKFSLFSVDDRLKVLRMLRDRQRTELLNRLKLVEADKATMFGELTDFDARRYNDDTFIEHMNTLQGLRDALWISLQKHHAAEADAILSAMRITIEDTGPFVAVLTALRCGPVNASPNADEGDSPNPVSGGGSTTAAA